MLTQLHRHILKVLALSTSLTYNLKSFFTVRYTKTQYLLSFFCHLIIFWQNLEILLTVTTELTIYMGTHANYGQHTKRDLGEGSMTLGNFFELILPFNLSKHNCFLSPSFNTSFTLYLKMFKLTQFFFVLLTVDWKDFNDSL